MKSFSMITLRDDTADDAEQLVVLANNKHVSRYLVATFPYPYTRSDALAWIATGCMANVVIFRDVSIA